MTNTDISKMADLFEKQCLSFVKNAKIRKLPNGKYRVLSKKNKNLGTFDTKTEALTRLRQVEFFKHKKASEIIDLSKIDELSYSAIMRELKKNSSQMMSFLKIYKDFFDQAILNELQKPEKIALQKTLISLNKEYPIKIKKDLIKNAAIGELGNPEIVGKYLSDIVRFILNRISIEKRPGAILKLRNKIYYLDEREISTKKLPASSSMGQSITFIKHVLFNHDAPYVRQVLNSIVRNLA